MTILALISINVPGIAKRLQKTLLDFIYLDILLADMWFLKLFYIDEDEKPESLGRLLLEDDSFEDEFESEALNSYFDENGF